jgi:hypothetical protein
MSARDKDDDGAAARFKTFLAALVRVPKREIDEQEAQYRKRKDAEKSARKRQRA